jgi:hypothetical protein
LVAIGASYAIHPTSGKEYSPKFGRSRVLQGWSHELRVVLLVYLGEHLVHLLHTPALANAPIHLFPLGAQLDELLEGQLRSPWNEGRKDPPPLGAYDLVGVDSAPRDEDVRSCRRSFLALADQDEELSLK